MDFVNPSSQQLMLSYILQSLGLPWSTVASSKSARFTQGPDENTPDNVLCSRAFELYTFFLILIFLAEFHPQ